MAPTAKSLRKRMAFPVFWHQDPRQVGVTLEGDPEHVVHLALQVISAGVQLVERVAMLGSASGTWARRRTRSIESNRLKLATTSKRSANDPSGKVPRTAVGEVVHGGDVHAHGPARLQHGECRLVPVFPCNVEHLLISAVGNKRDRTWTRVPEQSAVGSTVAVAHSDPRPMVSSWVSPWPSFCSITKPPAPESRRRRISPLSIWACRV